MSILKAIHNALVIKEKRGWDRLYFAVDLHGTVLVPNYSLGDIPKEFYPMAKEVLQKLSSRNDIVLIIYTCSFPNEIEEYLNYFKSHGINFDYVNSNPEVKTKEGGVGYFKDKFYFNVLLEDKAGFDPLTEWDEIYDWVRYDNE
jgi:hypothetical protein